MQVPDYIITTAQCVVPHIIDLDEDEALKKPIVIYVDDILYKDSYYDKGGTKTLKEFLAIENEVILAFREKAKTLVSKRGNYKLTNDRYEELLSVLKPDHYPDFQTAKNCYRGTEIIEPKSIDDLPNQILSGAKILGTGFIKEMSEKGKMLKIVDNRIFVKNIFDCSCCGDLSSGYLEYIYSIKEMNAMKYIMLHNIKSFGNLLDQIRRGEVEGIEIVHTEM